MHADKRTRSRQVALACCFAPLLLLASCGDDDVATEPIVRGADQIQVTSPEEAAAANAEADERAAAEAEAAATDETLAPEEGDDEGAFGEQSETVAVEDDRTPEEKMFEAFREFRDCLETRGTEFIGAPDASGEGPTNDPAYLESLGICAQQSDIVSALEESQAAAESLTPEQVEERNEGVLVFVDCMEGRGWTVEMTTQENGMLQPSGMTGPNGETPLDSNNTDLEDCAAEAQTEVEG